MIGKMKERGITLVALVVTIIIILILAGVTISQITGDNGLISRTKQAKVEYEKESLKEEIRLALLDKQLEKNGELGEDEIIEVLDKYGDVTGNGKDMKLTTDGTSYEITYEEIMNGETTSDTAGGGDSGSDSEGGQGKVEVSQEEFNQMQEKLKKLDELEKRLNAIDGGTTSTLSLNDVYNKNPKIHRVNIVKNFTASNELIDTGAKFKLQQNCFYSLGVHTYWSDGRPLEMVIKRNDKNLVMAHINSNDNAQTDLFATIQRDTRGSDDGVEFSVWIKSDAVGGNNQVTIRGFYIDLSEWSTE